MILEKAIKLSLHDIVRVVNGAERRNNDLRAKAICD